MSPALRAWSWMVAVALSALLAVGAIATEAPSGTLEGAVLRAEDNHPIAGARVTASGPVTRTVISGPDGHYRFARLPVGSYNLSAGARRHEPQWQEKPTPVEEARIAGGLDFRLADQAPALETAQVQRVFAPKEPIALGLRGALLSKLHLSLSRLDLPRAAADQQLLDDLRHGKIGVHGPLRGLLSPVKQWSQGIPAEAAESNGWFFHRLALEALPEGQYVVEVRGEPEAGLPADAATRPLSRAYWFGVSRLGLVTKRERYGLLAYACDLSTNKPLPGVALTAIVPQRYPVQVRTGADGLARLRLPTGSDVATLRGKLGDSEALVLAGYSGYDATHRLLTYTDRPIYRPGQVVHAKAIVRRLAPVSGYLPPRPEAVSLSLLNGRGDVVQRKAGTSTAFGGYSADFTLPANADLGNWSVDASAGKESQSIELQVAEYRKPEYVLDLVASDTTVIAGDTLRVAVRGRYLFGAPATGLKLQASAFVSSLPPVMEEGDDFFAGYLEGPGHEEAWGFGEELEQQEGSTDPEGLWVLNIPTPPMGVAEPDDWVSDRRLNVVVEGVDASGRAVKAKLRVNLMQGNLRVTSRVDRVVAAPNQSIGLDVQVKDLKGKPTAARGEVRVSRLEAVMQKSPEGDEYYKTISHAGPTLPWTAGADGRAHVDAKGLGEGHHLFEIVARDDAGRPIISRDWAWVAGEGEADVAGTWRPEALRLVLDKTVYKPGDTAKLLIAAPKPGVSALVTVENRGVLHAQVVPLPTGVGRVALKLDAAWMPHATVNVSVVDGKEFLNGSASVNIRPEARFLKLSVAADKASYHPGDTAHFTLRATDVAGRPVKAELSLGLVDEAIYQLAPDPTPEIRQHFHGPEDSTVETAYSFAEDYAGGLDKFADDARVRSRFEDTAAWFPSVVTDAKGLAKVEVKLPDNLTTWVATVRGSSLLNQVGQGYGSVLSTKDVVLRLALPRFLNVGDQVEAMAIAHERAGLNREVAFAIQSQGLAAQAENPGPGPLEAKGERSISLPFLADKAGEALVAAGVSDAKASGAPVLDALRLKLPVAPFAVQSQRVALASLAAADPFATTLVWPEGADPASLRLNLSWRTSPKVAVAAAIGHLRNYRYGCSEQTSSRLLAETVSQRYLRAAKLELPGDAEWKARGQAMVDQLLGLRLGDGGWGWWSGDSARPELSAYAVMALAEAKMAGLKVEDYSINPALAYLKQELPKIQDDVYTRNGVQRSAGADTRAMMLLALSRWNQAPGKELAQAVATRSKLSRYGLAQLTWALSSMKDPAAGALAVDLVAAGQEDESMLVWPAEGSTLSWQDDDEEATAYGLLALLSSGQDGGAPAAKAARYLAAHGAKAPGSDTKVLAATAWALGAWMAAHPATEGPSGLHVRLDGEDIPLPSAVGTGELASFDLGPEVLKPSGQHLAIALDGVRPADLVLTFRSAQAAESVAAAGTQGVTLSRRYLRLSAQDQAKILALGEEGALNPEFAKKLSEAGPELRVGDRVLVELLVQSGRSLPFVQIDDPLPAGLESLQSQPMNAAFPWEHVERHDDRTTFFSAKLPKGEHRFYHLLQVSQAGRYRALPPQLLCSYAPEWQARGLFTAFHIGQPLAAPPR